MLGGCFGVLGDETIYLHRADADMSIPQRKQGSPGDNDNQVPCFAGL